MARTLPEYVDWLDGRDDLIWPAAPKHEPVKATPFFRPLAGIRAVTWSVYGTLLRISDGRLYHDHPQDIRMQVAIDKTIHEFKMWNSMTRKPGAPWEYLLPRYREFVTDRGLVGNTRKGNFPEVDSSAVWKRIIGLLGQKEYDYDRQFFGDLDEFSEKVAWFFHSSLQGTIGNPRALGALKFVRHVGLRQGLLATAQSFTLVQLLRGLQTQGKLPPLRELFDPDLVTLTCREGIRKPSKSLYSSCIERFGACGIEPDQILHVGTRIRGDLAAARQAGMKTALFAFDKSSLEAEPEDLRDPDLKPDRLITDLSQIRDILSNQ